VYGRPRAAQNEEGRGYSKEESRPSSTLLTSERFPARRKVNRLPAVHRGGVAPPTDGADGFARGDPSAALGMAESEDPGPAHPVVEALRGTTDAELRRPMSEHGTVLGAWLGEDEIIRGERERPGPLVREASPGVYKGEEDIVRPVRDA
jgi:hypothetical protein